MPELTGKCLGIFVNWLDVHRNTSKHDFDNMSILCQHAYIVDFFDSQKIYITTEPAIQTDEFAAELWGRGMFTRIWKSTWRKDRTTALQAGIEKANQLFNTQEI